MDGWIVSMNLASSHTHLTQSVHIRLIDWLIDWLSRQYFSAGPSYGSPRKRWARTILIYIHIVDHEYSRLMDWLIDWLIDWWMDGWMDWLIDGLIDKLIWWCDVIWLSSPFSSSSGGAAVVSYCREIHINNKQARMRHIILTTQHVLQQIQDRQLAGMKCLKPSSLYWWNV
jgi:hypothetical protein